MTTLSVQLDEAALKAATVNAINGILSPETKEKIVQQAIQHILTPSRNTWEKGESPLEGIFRSAVMEVARTEASRIVKEDEGLKDKIRELMRQTAEKMLLTEPDQLASKMAEAFIDSIRRQ